MITRRNKKKISSERYHFCIWHSYWTRASKPLNIIKNITKCMRVVHRTKFYFISGEITGKMRMLELPLFISFINTYLWFDLPGSVRVGALIYSTNVKVQFHLNRYRRKVDVMTAIDRIPYIYGSTNTADAIKTMRDEMFTFR